MLAACSLAMIILIAAVGSGLSQTVGIPPASTFIGTPHRAPDGSIVVEPPSGAPQSSAPAALPRRKSGKGASNTGEHPSPSFPAVAAPSPGENGPSNNTPQPSAVANSRTGPTSFRPLTPDELDDVSWKAIAWEHLDYDQCRRDLRNERAQVGGTQTGTAASVLLCTNCR